MYCTYNVTHSRIHWCREKAESITYFCVRVRVCVCVWGGGYASACSLTYPACNAYCHLCPLSLHHILRHYLINGKIFEKKSLNIKCMFLFSLQILSETSPILRWIQRDKVINVKTSSWKSIRYACQILMKFEFSRQIFEKAPTSNFVKVRPVGAELLQADGRTWRS
jgi:hypothetical protein